MLKNLKIYEKRQRAAEAEIRESELRALRNQINPHFLYNTLNMVRWMARFAGTENIEECVRALGAIITPLYKDDSPTCTLRKEIELLNQYLTIMNFRCNGGQFLYRSSRFIAGCDHSQIYPAAVGGKFY